MSFKKFNSNTVAVGVAAVLGRISGDRHYDSAAKQDYVFDGTAFVGLGGGSKSTSGFGLPTVAGRAVGDLAYDESLGREYVLTSAVLPSFADTFSTPATGSLSTRSTETGGAAYTVQTGSASVSNGVLNVPSSGVAFGFALGSAGSDQDVAYSFTYPGTGGTAASQVITLKSDAVVFSNGNIGYEVSFAARGDGTTDLKITRRNAGTNTILYGPTASPVVGTSNDSTMHRLRARFTASTKTIDVFYDGALIASVVDPSAALTGTFFTAYISYIATLDNFAAAAAGGNRWVETTPSQEVVNIANTGAAYTIPDVTMAALHHLTLTATCTFTFPTYGTGKSFTIELIQDATGSRTATWPATVKWPGGTAPTLTTTAGKADIVSFVSGAGGSWLGSLNGSNY